jgi:hypothetical protein
LTLTLAENPTGGFLLNVAGPSGETCILEMTTNLLVSDGWQALFTNGFDLSGAARFVDPSATNDPQRFYRVRLGP